MTTCIVAFCCAFTVSLLATLVVRRVGMRFGIVDKPDSFRKRHARAVPRVGGLAIFGGFIAPLAALYLFFPHLSMTEAMRAKGVELLWLAAAAGIACGMGLYDDIKDIRPRWKLVFQLIAATVAYQAGFRISAISLPLTDHAIYFGWFSFPVTVFWFVGCMNAVNLLDGLDGLAAGVCLFASVTLMLVSIGLGQSVSVTTLLMACLSGAILGFLIFNFHPASIFLGDCGSMLLGFLIAALALHGSRKAETAVAILIPVLALGLPIFDTGLAVLRRWSRKLPLSAGDRQHIHHTLLAMGLSQKKVVIVLYLACILLCGAALLITMERSEITVLVLGSLAVLSFVCIRVFGRTTMQQLWQRVSTDLKNRNRSNEAKLTTERALVYMTDAATPEDLWEAFTTAIETLDMDFATLECDETSQFPAFLAWCRDRDDERPVLPNDEEADIWWARLKISNEEIVYGLLQVGKRVGDEDMLPDGPQLLARLRDEFALHVHRLCAEPTDKARRKRPRQKTAS